MNREKEIAITIKQIKINISIFKIHNIEEYKKIQRVCAIKKVKVEINVFRS